MRRIELSREQLTVMAEHAVADLPHECCGVLLGRVEGERTFVSEVVETPNAAVEPTRGYEIAPRALVAAHRRARDSGLEVVGYYHSHPGGRAVPSHRDQVSAWSETSYLIVATEGGVAAEQRGWRLGSTGRFEEQLLDLSEIRRLETSQSPLELSR